MPQIRAMTSKRDGQGTCEVRDLMQPTRQDKEVPEVQWAMSADFILSGFLFIKALILNLDTIKPFINKYS
ncbi:MAG: hypothetical protein RL160_2079 [Bacteroidota bacterium]